MSSKLPRVFKLSALRSLVVEKSPGFGFEGESAWGKGEAAFFWSVFSAKGQINSAAFCPMEQRRRARPDPALGHAGTNLDL